MKLFRAYLVVAFASLSSYTLFVVSHQGWNLFSVFFSSIAELAWPGQFNLDFMMILGISGIWVAWRHQFTGKAVVLGLLAFFGGMVFLAPYLFWASAQAKGDARTLLLGKERAHH